jgi:serine/threonine protein kinase/tetratricopeptide (TPR) repeat protein
MIEEELFHRALEKPTLAEQLAFLDEVCADQPELRARVERLVRSHLHEDSFLQGGVTADQPITETAGTVIGPYKLLERIGEGGMGTVWMAQQSEPVKRVVALKLIKAGMNSKQVIARFEAERQALALMDHANIARVLDAGTSGAGRPYFVMDLVKGVPITRYCDEHHLTPRQRLELFVPVCQAVQHAHQKGIIHRDLKPSNVLVALYDGKPVPKVIDFGVAKAAGQSLTDKTLVTGFGNIVGTLEYMSPEQAEVNQLDIDTRSDIYSLGVLLYELLTGSPPFTRKDLEKAGMLEMLRVIREQEPSKPSTKLSTAEGLPTLAANRGTEPAKLTRLVRGELDWIVMKALEKDRSRRYETANGFALDVQRYLADEAVLACPPSVSYRLRKFARRNKGGLAVTALVLFFLVLLGSGIGWAVRDQSAREALAAQQQAARQGKLAGQVESIFAEVDRLEKEQKWPEALAAARRAEAAVNGGEADAQTELRVRERLKDLEFIDRLGQVRLEKATPVAGAFNLAGTDRHYARAFRDYGVDIDKLAADESIVRLKTRPALAIALAAALDEWAFVRRDVGKDDPAGWKRLVAVARGMDPDLLRDRLRSTWGRPVAEVQDELRRLAESIDVRSQHSATVVSLTGTLRRANLSDSAVRLLREAQLASPGDFWINFDLGTALTQENDHVGVVRFYAAAVAVRPNSSAALCFLGYALRGQKKLPEAIEAFRRAIELDAKFSPPYYELGNVLYTQKKPGEGARALRLGLEHDNDLKELLAQDSNPTPTTRRLMAYTAPRLLLVDDTDGYRRLCTRLIAGFGDTEEPDAAYLVARTCALAPDTASDPTRLVQIAERAVRAERVPHYLHTLGLTYYRAGRFDEAIRHLHESIAGKWNANVANWLVLAMAQQRLGHVDEARKWYDQAVAWIDNPGADALCSLHGIDNLDCLVLRREAETLLGLRPEPEGKEGTAENK